MIKYTDKDSTLKPQLLKLRDSFKAKNKSALIFRFVEVKILKNFFLKIINFLNRDH
jgi:hypothetical protein